MKLALTLDGRIATRTGASRWITGAAARRRGHELRAVHDAILVGAGTVRSDDPALTCRVRGGRDPIRIVVAGPALDLPRRARVLTDGVAPTWVLTTNRARADRVAALERHGIVVVRVPARGQAVPLDAGLRALGEAGITSVLIEGGGRIAAALIGARVVDRVVAFVAPTIVGGDGIPAVAGFGVRDLAAARHLRDVRTERLGRDLVVTGTLATADRQLPFASAWPPR
jgi:diaminohydroxyphosphoribosylaminopyrimidine deaminase/5-amino-6-(5-phosphoribosylamino)uracil reductase